MNLLLTEILLQHDYKLSLVKATIAKLTWDKTFSADNDLYLGVDFYYNGNLAMLGFFNGRLLHRPHTEGPALIQYDAHGNIISQQFFENDRRHRPHTEGPASISYHENGTIWFQGFWENGVKIK